MSPSAAGPLQQTQRSGVAREGGSSMPPIFGMRRSCNECGRRKQKCDGFSPCSRCVKAGADCVYSKRKWHLPQPQQNQQRQQQPRGDDQYPRPVLMNSVPGMLPFKRCRLRASAATGLVGMQENLFLGDFFSCVGFLPLATQSDIRDTMVNLMATLPNFSEEGRPGGTAPEELGGTVVRRIGPSECIFWCAVGLGAVLKGSPVDSVSRYLELARDELESWSGPVDAVLAKAWVILGFLYLYCGNMEMFHEYTERSGVFLNTCIEQGSTEMLPVGLAEMMQHRMTVKVSAGDADTGELNEFATESDLFLYAVRSARMFEQSVYRAAYRQGAISAAELSGDAEPPHEGARVDPRPIGESPEVVDTLEGRIREMYFEQLEEAVDRPNIRNGIGGIIINGFLAFEKATIGDRAGTLVRIARIAEVFDRFPGLCRAGVTQHQLHLVVITLAAMEGSRARHLYDKLRVAYNITRLPTSAPLPPLEEWQGISSCCDWFYCRAIEGVVLRKDMNCRSVKPPNIVTNDVQRSDYKDDPPHGLERQNQNGSSAASNISDDTAAGVMAEVSGTREIIAECRESSRVGDSVGNEDGLLYEDWLEATLALLDGAEVT